ncbi:MAG: alpha/beta family hydrolase [Gammaproteobacteria bacterium]
MVDASAAVSARTVSVGPQALEGLLAVPAGALGLVIFAHGSGSSRLSSRNTRVAEHLQTHGLATLLFDLLHEDEARDRANVFDIALLGSRVEAAVAWAHGEPALAGLRLGLFGASTGAAAALMAAARRPTDVAAVVSRGGRPDLAAPHLAAVRAPTLLIVGGADTHVLALNRQAYADLRCEKRLDVVPGATHLFEEPGALGQVVDVATGWFEHHLAPAAPAGSVTAIDISE